MKKSQKPILFILCFFIVSTVLVITTNTQPKASQDVMIRIALYHDVSSLSSSGSKASIEVSAMKGVVFGYVSGGAFNELHYDTSPERYTIRASTENTYDISLYRQSGEHILTFDSRTGHFQARPGPENFPKIIRLGDYYRGYFEFRRFSNIGKGQLTVINEVNLEEYLYGVVPREMQASSHIEALKAQSVAARTYAYRHLQAPKSPYDRINAHLSDATDSQVYYGYAQVNRVTGALIPVEKLSTNQAVDQTKGQTLTYNGSYIYAFYSSSNGGSTEASENVWFGSHPYLQTMPDYYELTSSSRYFWERTFTSEQLRNIVLSDSGGAKDIGLVTKVEIISRSISGRPTQIMLTGTQGSHSIYKSGCRTAFSLNGQMYDVVNDTALSQVSVLNGHSSAPSSVSPDTLTIIGASGITARVSRTSVINGSTQFRAFANVTSESNTFTFIGRGWGHAVGMSQEGAKGMAQNGFTYRQILSFYYPGTVLR